MGFGSGFNEREVRNRRILRECAHIRRRHEELEERYEGLVNGRPLDSKYIREKNNNFDIGEDEFDLDLLEKELAKLDLGRLNKPINPSEPFFVPQFTIYEAESEAITSEKTEAECEAAGELETPSQTEVEEIEADFMESEETIDAGTETCELFQEETVKPVFEENIPEPDETAGEIEVFTPTYNEDELKVDGFGGIGPVYAKPIENKQEKASEKVKMPLRKCIMGIAAAVIVLIIGIAIIYAMWPGAFNGLMNTFSSKNVFLECNEMEPSRENLKVAAAKADFSNFEDSHKIPLLITL